MSNQITYMSSFNFITVLQLFSVLSTIGGNFNLPPGNLSAVRSKRDTCVPDVWFPECKSSSQHPMILYNTLRYRMEVIALKGCRTSDISIAWSLLDRDSGYVIDSFKDKHNRRSVTISKYQLSLGNYVLTAYVTESPGFGMDYVVQTRCYIKMTSDCPVPIITGGILRNAPQKSSFILDASKTLTCKLKVEYLWKCSSLPSYPSCEELHKQIGQIAFLEIEAPVGHVYVITLTANARLVPERHFRQKITVTKAGSPIARITCVKNCISTGVVYPNPVVPIYLEAQCDERCELIKRYEWIIYAHTSTKIPLEEIIANGTYTGLKSKGLIIKRNQFNYEEKFSIYLKAYGKHDLLVETMVYINMTRNVGGQSKCTAQDNGEKGMNRFYKITCKVPPGLRPVIYKLQQMYMEYNTSNNIGFTLAYSNIPEFTVRLSVQGHELVQNLTFIVMDDNMIMTNTTFQVKVLPVFGSVDEDTKIKLMRQAYKGTKDITGVIDFFEAGKMEEATQILNILLVETSKMNSEDKGIENLQTAVHLIVMRDILQIYTTHSDIEYILSLVPHLVIHGRPKHLRHSKLRSRLCKKLAIGVNHYFHNEDFPLRRQGFLELITIPLLKCANYYLDNDYRKNIIFHVPLPDPIEEHMGYVEDYPNYGDVLDTLSIEDHREVTANALATINAISEAYSKTFVIGEPRAYINYTANTTIELEFSEKMYKTSFEDKYVSLRLPDSLGFDEEDVTYIVYTTLPAEAFFWDDTRGNISNSILNLNIYGPRNTKITKFPKPIHVFFKLDQKQNITIRSGEMEIPLLNTRWTDEFVEKYMKLYRVEVEKGNTLMTFVKDIQSVKSLRVAITKGRKPTRPDFTYEIKNTRTEIFNKSDADMWYYIAFLPREEEILKMADVKESKSSADYYFNFMDDYTITLNTLEQRKLKIKFNYAFTAMNCKEWSGHMWNVDHCDVGLLGNLDTMHCICSEITTLVADMKDVEINEERTKQVEYKLTRTINIIIPAIVLIIFGIYCITICFISFRKKPISIYFLSDNLKEDRYAYLIVINTGDYEKSGTTSNVTIKLCGKKADSKPHVLNYPDPNLKILQTGCEDWFILTTYQYLGDIIEIQLWYDGIGSKYTWYCNYLNIYDLQTETSWFVGVNKHFTVIEENMNNFVFQSSNEKTWKSNKKIESYFHFYWTADHTWNVFDKRDDAFLTFFERATIILCEILSTYTFTLAICGCPTFRLKDGIGENKFDSFNYIFWNSALVAVLVFGIHMPLAIVFRYVPKKRSTFRVQNEIFSMKVNSFCWIFMAGDICVNIAYIMWFSFWVSFVTSIVWVVISTTALLINIFLLENISLGVYKLIKSRFISGFRRRYVLNFKQIITETERQRKYVYEKLGQYALRPYLTHLYKPISNERDAALREQKTMEFKVSNSVSDMAFFYLYTSLLFLLLLSKLNSMTYINSNHIMTMTLYGEPRNEFDAYRVKSFEDFYIYLNETLAKMLHPMEWYGRWKVSESGLLGDYNTKILGVARIRQKRVKQTYCQVRHFSRALNIEDCRPEYSSGNAERSDTGLSKSIWSYQKVDLSNWHVAEISRYSGSGYIAYLGRNLNNTYYMIQLMKDSYWINRKTRAVFIEFWTYNANQNLFSAVTVLFERSATQYIFVSKYIITLELMHTRYDVELMSIIIFIVFCIFVFRLTLKYIRKMVKYRLKIFLGISNLWEISIIATNITIVYLYLQQFQEHLKMLRELSDTKNNEFIHYFKIMNTYRNIQVATAIMFALAIARGITFMKFIPLFQVFERTLLLSFSSFASVIIFSYIIIIMFAFSGYIIFNAYASNFRSLQASMYTLLKQGLAISSDFDRKLLEDYNKNVGYLYYTIFSILIMAVKNIYVATAILFYEKSRQSLSKFSNAYSLARYTKDKWKFYSEFWKRHLLNIRLKGGEDSSTKEVATPKEYHFRYGDSIIMPNNKLRCMALIVKATLTRFSSKRQELPTQEDIELMKNLVLVLFGTQEDDTSKSIFVKCTLADGKVKFIRNNKLLQMAYLVNNVLTKRKKTTETYDDLENALTLKRLEEIENVLTTADVVLGNISVKSVKKKRT